MFVTSPRFPWVKAAPKQSRQLSLLHLGNWQTHGAKRQSKALQGCRATSWHPPSSGKDGGRHEGPQRRPASHAKELCHKAPSRSDHTSGAFIPFT